MYIFIAFIENDFTILNLLKGYWIMLYSQGDLKQ